MCATICPQIKGIPCFAHGVAEAGGAKQEGCEDFRGAGGCHRGVGERGTRHRVRGGEGVGAGRHGHPLAAERVPARRHRWAAAHASVSVDCRAAGHSSSGLSQSRVQASNHHPVTRAALDVRDQRLFLAVGEGGLLRISKTNDIRQESDTYIII
jgi:hypothetical protein